MSFLVATTSLPAVGRPNANRWNAARACQYFLSGAFVIKENFFEGAEIQEYFHGAAVKSLLKKQKIVSGMQLVLQKSGFIITARNWNLCIDVLRTNYLF